jgi:hypothetical protein
MMSGQFSPACSRAIEHSLSFRTRDRFQLDCAPVLVKAAGIKGPPDLRKGGHSMKTKTNVKAGIIVVC